MIKKIITVFLSVGLWSSSFAYSPPPGIPDPNWTTHPIDTPTPTQPSPWDSAQTGYYYVDSSGTCSDATNGYPASPRCTIPTSGLSAGVKIFVKKASSLTSFSGVSGTSEAPIWIIGVDGGLVQPEQTGSYINLLNSDWIFFDGITIDGTNTPNSAISIGFYITAGCDYIVFRNSTVQDMTVADYNEATGYPYWRSALTSIWPSGGSAGVANVVYYNLSIQNNAGGQTLDYESGRHCLVASGYLSGTTTYKVSNLWVLNSTLHNNPEDGLQFGLSALNSDNTGINHVYVGNNVITNNGENAIDLKATSDVVISKNTMSGYVSTSYRDGANSGSDGSAGVINDDGGGPINDWWIFNTFSNSRCGIRNQSYGGNHYLIGNVFYDLNKTTVEAEPSSAGSNAGVAYWQSATYASAYLVNNTIYDVHGAMYFNNANLVHVEGNIVSDIVAHASGWPVVTVNAVTREMSKNIYYDKDGNVRQDADALGGTDQVNVNPLLANPPSNLRSEAAGPGVDVITVEPSVYATFQTLYGLDIRKSIDGTTRPVGSSWDIGAYEYTDGGPSPIKVRGFRVRAE